MRTRDICTRQAGTAVLVLAASALLSAQGAPLLVLNRTTAALDFATQDIGTTGDVQALTISNGGTGTLTIGAVALGGEAPGDFQIVANSCSGAALGAGALCSVSVAFHPTAAGVRSARVSFASNASGSPQLVPVLGRGVVPGAAQPQVGPIDARIGFPAYYTDANGLSLQPCITDPVFCLVPVPDPTLPPSVVDGPGDNIQDEFFYHVIESDFPTLTQRTLVRIALEGAFVNEVQNPGEAVVFGRVRVRVLGGLVPGRFYRLTHPYGVEILQAEDDGTGDGEINFTDDMGSFVIPSDHAAVLTARVPFPFVTWTPLSDAPPGFIGDPSVEHRITPGPRGDFIRFEELACTSEVDCQVNPRPVRILAENNLFVVQGQLFTPPAATPPVDPPPPPPPPPPPNQAPVATDDAATTTAGTAVTVAVLANDSDPDGNPLSVVSTANVVGGTTAIQANGSITYTPSVGFSGAGSFTYTISDGQATASAVVRVTVAAPPPPPPPADGLVLALGFDEVSGATATDSSPSGRNGTITGALRVPGKVGNALSFDGIDDWVTVIDGAAGTPLDLTTGLTVEAWVNPAAMSGWETVVLKEAGTNLMSYGLYAHDGAPRPGGVAAPAGYVRVAGVDQAVRGISPLALNTWTHVATTYDGTTQRIYVNGTLVASRAQSGAIAVGNQPLRIGGNASFAGEFFQGLIDEVRVYNRARTEQQIQADMTTPISQ